MELYYPNQVIMWRPEELELLPEGVKLPRTVGYIPVYSTLEELRKDFPDAPYRVERWDGNRNNIDDTEIRPKK